MENKSKLTLYVIDLSQPSRAVMLFCALNGIEYEKRHLDIAKRELRSKEFAKINPNKQVPVMTDGEFKLFESHTIMKYLFHTRQCADHWYPVDIYQRSIVDQYLDWHHTHLRIGGGHQIYKRIFGPAMGLKPAKEDIEMGMKVLLSSLDYINKLLSDSKYLCGDQMTIADITAFCEIIELAIIEVDYTKFENVKRWMNDLLAIPQFKDSSELILPFIKQYLSTMKAKM